MKKQTIWLVVSCLVALSLVMAACAPAAQTTPATPTTTAKPTATAAPTSPGAKPAVTPTEKPKYGGVFRIGRNSDILDFDDVIGIAYRGYTQMATNEPLWSGDWTKGPAGGYGTNETDWMGLYDVWEHKAGYIAESWELPTKMEGDTAAIVYHIRKGIRWALNPNSEASKLVNGRELTADDVLFSLKYVISTPRSNFLQSSPDLGKAKITAPDKWTVKVEVPWESVATAITRFTDYVHIVPPEVVQKYGNMADWKNSVGTGPFMLTDFVKGSVATLERNPNYWMKNQIGPGKGDQLPYLDAVKLVIITDSSTRNAAMRTAKVDWLGSVGLEDAKSLIQTTPKLLSAWLIPSPVTGLGMNTTKVPYNDVRVRRALMMAIDFQKINKELFGGIGQIQTWPIVYWKEYAGAYLGLDDPDMPASVKELYSYNPEKAKALLKEAGYPNGFKTNAIIGTSPMNGTGGMIEADYYSLYVDYWSKIGVTVELKPTETGAKTGLERSKSYDAMVSSAGASPVAMIYVMNNFRGVGIDNRSVLNDPVVEENYAKIQKLVVTAGRDEANRQYRELMKYVLDQAFTIPSVAVPQYTLWWPWL
ncbi:MAG: ABC transporter substrate-binding protein, partial [Chloroflexi bacterium]|nr:ABC transporter substrate-binding protein [Chloroflexota bacterium]